MKKLLSLMLLLTGCATGYHEAGMSGGYEDFKSGPNKYVVTFNGNSFTNSNTTTAYVIRRAEEICERQNKDFNILQKNIQYFGNKPQTEVIVECLERVKKSEEKS